MYKFYVGERVWHGELLYKLKVATQDVGMTFLEHSNTLGYSTIYEAA